MGEIHFGIQTIPNQPWPVIAEQWQTFEAFGFDSLWLPDHLVPPLRPTGPLFEAWTLLAALATRTERVRIGVLVSCNTFRHPALLAKEVVTLDHISGGRLEFGFGAGWFAPEHEMFGIEFPSPTDLVSRYREEVEVVDRLLRDDGTTYDGEHYHLQDALCHPKPLQRPRPPLVLGAHGPKMLRIVAEYADTWNSIGTVHEIRERNDTLDEQCAVINRDGQDIRRSLLYVPALMPSEKPWDSVDAFRDFVGRFHEAGMREFILQPPPVKRFSIVETVAGEVIPELHRELG